MGTVVAVVLLLGVAAALLYPYLRPALEPVGEPAGPAARMAALEERKAALYGAIRDLGFDLRTDKLTEDDYHQEVATLKREAVVLVAEIEQLRAEPPKGPESLERRIHQARERLSATGTDAASFCTQCGRGAAAGDRFCGGCGHALTGVQG